MYFLIDMAIVNGFIIWKQSKQGEKEQILNQLSFRLRLAKQLIDGFNSRNRRGRPINHQNKKKAVP